MVLGAASKSFQRLPVQLNTTEEAVAVRSTELEEVLASHKAVQQAKDQAKAALAATEQQLLADRAARDAQIQQHTSLVSLCCLSLASCLEIDSSHIMPSVLQLASDDSCWSWQPEQLLASSFTAQ